MNYNMITTVIAITVLVIGSIGWSHYMSAWEEKQKSNKKGDLGNDD